MKKREFSKIITFFLTINILAMFWASLLVMFLLQDTTALSFFITGASSALTVVVGFYFHKAQKENLLKIQNAEPPVVTIQRVDENQEKRGF